MISRFLLCGLSLWIVCCVVAPTAGFGQESRSLLEADQNFKKALEIWGDGKSPEAEALLNRALSTRQEQLGPGDPKVAEVIERLGALNYNRGKYAEAEGLFRKALDIDVKALGEKSLPVAYAMGDVGAALREQGQYREAETIVERSLVLRRELLPPNHMGIAGGLDNLGRIYLGERRYSDARQAFEESLRIYGASLPADHLRVVQNQTLLKRVDAAEQAAGHFFKVFDVLDSGFKDWTFSAFGLIFVAIGSVIFFFPNLIRAAGIPYLNVQSRLRTFSRYGFIGFAILWTSITFFATYSQYLRHRALAQENRCRAVEGAVEHFVPMPYGGHAQESFSVDGVPFRYSDFIVTDGFNNTSSHGGPINSDSYVRICYDPSGGAILRLEIRDFKGEIKDYAKAQSIFPKPADIQKINGKNVAISFPWYSNLFFVLYILDFVGIYVLYLPYIGTFFRLKTATVRDCSIPATLEVGRKVNLRNSKVSWDIESRTIWLRPRGFNLVQIPLMVAKLSSDDSRASITAYEIRFSSGFPVVIAVFLWTAYHLFSATMPANANLPSPALFVGIAAALFLIVGFFNLRIFRSRMDSLVEDVLSEFKEMQNA
jgi:tetratricopeptide (TPR) repeat protein